MHISVNGCRSLSLYSSKSSVWPFDGIAQVFLEHWMRCLMMCALVMSALRLDDHGRMLGPFPLATSCPWQMSRHVSHYSYPQWCKKILDYFLRTFKKESNAGYTTATAELHIQITQSLAMNIPVKCSSRPRWSHFAKYLTSCPICCGKKMVYG